MTVIQTIERKRGDTLTPEEVTIIDEDSGDPKDISGNTFLMTVTTIEKPPDDSTKLFQVVGVLKVDQVTYKGEVEFPLTNSDADNVGNFFYDIQLTSGGKNDTVMEGEWIMSQDRTKD